MLKDFFALIFPQVCVACGKPLYKHEDSLCMLCAFKLPKTNFHLEKDNPIEKIFWGRVPVFSAASYYSFTKGGNVQHLIHQLKYKGQREVGVVIGEMYGDELKQSDRFNTVDVIIPVPLHKRKLKARGYNQSEAFAEGLSKSMKVPTDFETLYRALESETQTKKARFLRWKNVETIFQLKDEMALMGKHVLVVDDVITTGATAEACIQTLLKTPNVKVSIVTMAWASH